MTVDCPSTFQNRNTVPQLYANNERSSRACGSQVINGICDSYSSGSTLWHGSYTSEGIASECAVRDVKVVSEGDAAESPSISVKRSAVLPECDRLTSPPCGDDWCSRSESISGAPPEGELSSESRR